jgi:hypothetical protein
MPFRSAPVIIRGPKFAPIRAFRSETTEDIFSREKRFLGAELSGQESRLGRALRAERRAAATGVSYDLSRHIALARLCSRSWLRTSKTRHTSEQKITPGEEE